MSEETRPATTPERVATLEDKTSRLEAVVRAQGSRLAQIEDSVSFYGPPKRRALNIPELTREQRATLTVVAVLMFLAVLPVLITRNRRDYVAPI